MEIMSTQTPSHLDFWGDSLVPFSALMEQPTGINPALENLSGIFKLPEEIQLMILNFCDPATLFTGVMRSSSRLRSLAISAFWSHEAVWYLLSATEILLTIGSSYSKNQCVDFMRHIEQVDVIFEMQATYFCCRQPVDDNDQPLKDNPEVQGSKRFWEKLVNLCPSVKLVVLSSMEQYGLPYVSKSPDFRDFEVVVRNRPANIKVFASALVQKKDYLQSWERCLFRLERRSKWTLIERPWKRHRVVPPKQQVTELLGRLVQQKWKGRELTCRTRALREMRKEVYESYHFGGQTHTPFVCPDARCDVEFKMAGEYTIHLSHNRSHDGWVWDMSMKRPEFPSPLPEEIEQSVTTRELVHAKAVQTWVEDFEQVLRAMEGDMYRGSYRISRFLRNARPPNFWFGTAGEARQYFVTESGIGLNMDWQM
jgi:hypothetical protein